jgi:UDP-galactopyranose mutase
MINAFVKTDLLLFSHHRWDFIYRRPHHLASRYARYRRVFFFGPPTFGVTEIPRLHLREVSENLIIVIPYLPNDIRDLKFNSVMADLVDELIFEEELINYTAWYDNPIALSFTEHLRPVVTIFDFRKEILIPQYSTEILIKMENELMRRADIIFTESHSLYEKKGHLRHKIHIFSTTIDYKHFSQARCPLSQPRDQANIPHIRIGFVGVIDKRFNINLFREIAELRSNYQFIMIGPVVNIDPRILPRRKNIHYLDKKDYNELPLYLSSWDCGIVPYVPNEANQDLSSSKIHEFLAAGIPVVSTPMMDLITPHYYQKLIHTEDDPSLFVLALEKAMNEKKSYEWLDRVDYYLKDNTWELTFQRMMEIELEVIGLSKRSKQPKTEYSTSHYSNAR